MPVGLFEDNQSLPQRGSYTLINARGSGSSVRQGWDRYVGAKGDVICLDRFGASSPGDIALKNLGFNVDNIRKRAKSLLRGKDRAVK